MSARQSHVPIGARPSQLDELFRAHRGTLWRLSYSVTGSASDADDVVQDTFARFLERPPVDLGTPLRPWLVRVATNLAIDALRRRQTRDYVGPWLPSPVETADLWDEYESLPGTEPGSGPEARYGLLESVSFAFLLALEALDARQRAILVLREVLEHSAAEVARTLDMSEANVRIVHHRARRALATYDTARRAPDHDLDESTRQALVQLVRCLADQDAHGLEALLVDSIRTVTDGGGTYSALRAPLVGRAPVARFYLQAARMRLAGGPRTVVRSINGLPALLIELAQPVRRQAPLTVLRCELAADGRIRELHSILAPEKLVAVRPVVTP